MLGKYGTDFLYTGDSYKITKKHKELLKTLKGKLVNSSYADKVLVFDSIDHPEIDLETFKELSTTVTFFLAFNKLPEDFIKKYDVRPEHEALMRRVVIEQHDSIDDDFGEEDIWRSDNRYVFGLDYKRPYGNKRVIEEDVFKEWKCYNLKEYKKMISESIDRGNDLCEWASDNYDFLLEVHLKAMDIMQKALREVDFRARMMKKYSNSFSDTNWGIV
jgi:hypothetical protein